MPLSTDVTLPLDQRPEWPSRCVKCGEENPIGFFRFRASRVGLDQLVTLHVAIGSRPRVEVPACLPCATELRRRRWFRRLALWPAYIAIGVTAFIVLEKLGWMPTGAFRKWILVGEAVLAITPLFVWDVMHPPTIDATAKGKKLVYEFGAADYASDFAELNEGATVV